MPLPRRQRQRAFLALGLGALVGLAPTPGRGRECVLAPGALHGSATLGDEYVALQGEMKAVNRAFYEISTSIHAYASACRPRKALMKLDERILTLHAAILLREKTPSKLRRELGSILKELAHWRVAFTTEATTYAKTVKTAPRPP